MSLRAQFFGQPYGDAVKYYWLDVRFPCCDGPLYGPVGVVCQETLDQNNVVLCQWGAEPGATSYILMQSDAPVVPSAGDTCVVIQTGATSYSDCGAPLGEYTTFTPPSKSRPKSGTAIETGIAKPSPRPDRRQTSPENVKAYQDAKLAKDQAKEPDILKTPAKEHETHQTKKS